MVQVMWTVTDTGWEAGVEAMVGLQCKLKSDIKVQQQEMFRNWQVTAGSVVFWHCEVLGLCTNSWDFKLSEHSKLNDL
jgi:hypothetical protein